MYMFRNCSFVTLLKMKTCFHGCVLDPQDRTLLSLAVFGKMLKGIMLYHFECLNGFKMLGEFLKLIQFEHEDSAKSDSTLLIFFRSTNVIAS